MKTVRLDGSFIWFVVVPSSMAFHALIVFTLTFTLCESHDIADRDAQLLPIQFVLLSGKATLTASVAGSLMPVLVEAEAKPVDMEKVSEETDKGPNPEETYKQGGIEEETAIENEYKHADTVADAVITEEGALETNDTNNTLSDTLEVREEVPPEGLVQKDTHSSPQSHSEKHGISATSEQGVSETHPAIPGAGAQGNYEAVTEDYAMFGQNRPPPYPITARRNGWEGEVVLEIVVLPDGDCKNVEVVTSSSYEVLDKAAVKGVQQWKFVPARRNDKPVESTVILSVVFRLNH